MNECMYVLKPKVPCHGSGSLPPASHHRDVISQPRQVCVGFLVDNVAMEPGFLQLFRLYTVSIILTVRHNH
jgi:hypothetical protein